MLLIGGLLLIAIFSAIGYFVQKGIKGALIYGIIAIALFIGTQLATEGLKRLWGNPLEEIIKNQAKDIEDIRNYLKSIEANDRAKLTQEYPNGYKIIAATKNKNIVQVPNPSDVIKLDWDTVRVEDFQDKLIITFPQMQAFNNNFYNFSVGLPKKIGSKMTIIGSPTLDLYAEIIAIQDDRTFVALGIKKK